MCVYICMCLIDNIGKKKRKEKKEILPNQGGISWGQHSPAKSGIAVLVVSQQPSTRRWQQRVLLLEDSLTLAGYLPSSCQLAKRASFLLIRLDPHPFFFLRTVPVNSPSLPHSVSPLLSCFIVPVDRERSAGSRRRDRRMTPVWPRESMTGFCLSAEESGCCEGEEIPANAETRR